MLARSRRGWSGPLRSWRLLLVAEGGWEAKESPPGPQPEEPHLCIPGRGLSGWQCGLSSWTDSVQHHLRRTRLGATVTWALVSGMEIVEVTCLCLRLLRYLQHWVATNCVCSYVAIRMQAQPAGVPGLFSVSTPHWDAQMT